MAPKDLNFITGNKNKLAEVQAILSSTPVELKSQNVDLLEIQGTIEEISTDKARRAADAVSHYGLSDYILSLDYHTIVTRKPCSKKSRRAETGM